MCGSFFSVHSVVRVSIHSLKEILIIHKRSFTVKLVKHRCHLDLRKYFFCERVIETQEMESTASLSCHCDTINKFKGKNIETIHQHHTTWASLKIAYDLIGFQGRISLKSKDIRFLLWPHQVNIGGFLQVFPR